MRSDDPRLPPLDGDPGPALPQSGAAMDALVRAALDEALPAPRRRVAPWLAPPSPLLFVGLPAGAAIWRAVRTPRPVAPRTPPAPTPKTAPDTPPAAEARPVAPTAPEAPPTAARAEPAPNEAAKRPSRRPHRKTRRAPTPTPEPPPPPTAAALLDAANRARGDHNWQDALRAYGQVLERYPTSGAAYVARVAQGTLLLEHTGAPRAAVRAFEAALTQRPGGPLDAEARWGLARALRASQQAHKERTVLQELLRAHPNGAHAGAARARLEALEGRP